MVASCIAEIVCALEIYCGAFSDKRRHGNATFCGGWLGPQWPGSGPRDKCHGFVSGNDRPSVDLPPQSEIMYRIENVVVGAVWLVLLLVRYPVDINYAKIREITPCRPGREPKVAVVMVLRIEDTADVGSHRGAHGELWNIGLGVLLGMELAALPRG